LRAVRVAATKMNDATPKDTDKAPDRGRSRRIGFALATVAIAVVVTLLGLEGAVRVYSAAKNRWALHNLLPLSERVVIPSADPELIYELNPGAHRGDVSINAWGMRDDPTTLEKPPGCFRIAFVGDSISCGLGICEKRILYHDVLERELNAGAPPGRRFECLNFSANGYSIGQELRLFERRVRAFDPDVVVLQSCLNDPYPTESEYVHQQPMGVSRLSSTLWSRLAPESFYAWHAVESNYDDTGRKFSARSVSSRERPSRGRRSWWSCFPTCIGRRTRSGDSIAFIDFGPNPPPKPDFPSWI